MASLSIHMNFIVVDAWAGPGSLLMRKNLMKPPLVK